MGGLIGVLVVNCPAHPTSARLNPYADGIGAIFQSNRRAVFEHHAAIEAIILRSLFHVQNEADVVSFWARVHLYARIFKQRGPRLIDL